MVRKTPRKKRPKAAQVHPTGPLKTVEEPWKDDLREEMKTRGWDQQTLAEKIPASPGAISNMFKPGPRQTRLKDRIEELVGWVNTPQLEQVFRRVEHRWTKLSVAEAENIAGLIESLTKKKPASND